LAEKVIVHMNVGSGPGLAAAILLSRRGFKVIGTVDDYVANTEELPFTQNTIQARRYGGRQRSYRHDSWRRRVCRCFRKPSDFVNESVRGRGQVEIGDALSQLGLVRYVGTSLAIAAPDGDMRPVHHSQVFLGLEVPCEMGQKDVRSSLKLPCPATIRTPSRRYRSDARHFSGKIANYQANHEITLEPSGDPSKIFSCSTT
jgi:hypothetical protein